MYPCAALRDAGRDRLTGWLRQPPAYNRVIATFIRPHQRPPARYEGHVPDGKHPESLSRAPTTTHRILTLFRDTHNPQGVLPSSYEFPRS
jgi:hypothetical protein